MLQAPERLSHFDFWEMPFIITGGGGVGFLKELPYQCLCILPISIPVELQSTHLSVKAQKTNLLHFMGHVVSMATTPLCTKAASDDRWVNGCGCASITLHEQKWEVGGVCSDGCSLRTLPQSSRYKTRTADRSWILTLYQVTPGRTEPTLGASNLCPLQELANERHFGERQKIPQGYI